MKTHNLIQGSAAWHAYRADHFNASDAPAMMGCSPYMSRTELLQRMHTGISAEVDSATQRRFDDGHRFESLARPLAEKIIGEDLYPVTGSDDKLSASFDGLTMAEDVIFEHKTLNDQLRAALMSDEGAMALPLPYRVQMEQQCMVSGAKRVLFMASKWAPNPGTGEFELVDELHCWYDSDPALAAKITAGWKQFSEDLTTFVPTEVVQAAVATPTLALPAVSVQVNGSIAIISNLDVFGAKLREFIDGIDQKPETDQAFADTEAAVKVLEKAQEALEQAETHALAQTADIDTMRRTVKLYVDLARTTRLMLEKLVKARKEQIRVEIVQGGITAYGAHVAALNARIGKPYMPTVPVDFAGAIKGKKSVVSLKDAVATTLANAKIEASAVADRIQVNLTTLRELAADHVFLFPDTAQIVLKANDDLTALVKSRISEHKQAEDQRIADAVAAKALADAAAPPPAPVAAPARQVATLPPTAAPASPPTLTLGQIGTRLGFSLTGDFLKTLGFSPAGRKQAALLFHEADFARICDALVEHIQAIHAVEA